MFFLFLFMDVADRLFFLGASILLVISRRCNLFTAAGCDRPSVIFHAVFAVEIVPVIF